LLVNLGTPDAPTEQALKPYLKEFLMDPYVIRIPTFVRWVLVTGLIMMGRAKKSAKLYRNIWGERGSPLLYLSQDFTAKMRAQLGAKTEVALAMRYGKPGIDQALETLHKAGCKKVIVFPLYPHYALSSVTTCLERVAASWSRFGTEADLRYVPEFFGDMGYLESLSRCVAETRDKHNPEYFLFSYHGLPESHIIATDPSGQCLQANECCAKFLDHAPHCYRAQCYFTTQAVVRELGLNKNQYSSAFQSRLGRTPWLKPYTDHVLNELAQRGIKRLAVVCPAFTADCLETLEEITIRAKEQFIAAGGEDVFLVPALNDRDDWVQAACHLVEGSKPYAERPRFK
jgi:ferrochelatase